MGQFAEPAVVPFFATDFELTLLPGNCIHVRFTSTISGDVIDVVIPVACGMDMHLKVAKFMAEHVTAAGVASPEVKAAAH